MKPDHTKSSKLQEAASLISSVLCGDEMRDRAKDERALK